MSISKEIISDWRKSFAYSLWFCSGKAQAALKKLLDLRVPPGQQGSKDLADLIAMAKATAERASADASAAAVLAAAARAARERLDALAALADAQIATQPPNAVAAELAASKTLIAAKEARNAR